MDLNIPKNNVNQQVAMIIPEMIPELPVQHLMLTGTALHEPVLYIMVFLILFLECGFPPMIWLPGDSLLFLSGMYAAAGLLDLQILFLVYGIAGILGYMVNYALGRYAGLSFMVRVFPDMIPRKEMNRADIFFKRWGTPAVLLGRFVPIVRTLVPFIAGVAHMDTIRFLILACVSGLLWGPGICFIGYLFGSVPWLKEYQNIILFIIPCIIIGTTGVSLIAVLGRRNVKESEEP